jgi:predicted permease
VEVNTLPVLLQDVTYALRRLRKSPGFTVTAVLTLALGIGANTAIFTLIYVVMLKSLPVSAPEQLYRIGDNDNCCVWGGLQNDGWGEFSYPFFQYMQENTPEFEEMAAFQANEPRISVRRSGSDSPAEPFDGEFVSGTYFSTFGVPPFAGRLFTSQDDTPSAVPVVVMSYHAWQEHFGLDPSLVGSTVMVDGQPFIVVGIAPPGFYGDRLRADPPDFYFPIAFEPLLMQQSSVLHVANQSWLYVIGRMRPGARPSQVEAKLTGELRQWLPTLASHFTSQQIAKIPKQFIKIGPGGSGVVSLRNNFKTGLYLLIASSALVLLIACANLANLLLARGAARRQQTALQLAIGATRARLILASLTESVLLACIGGAAGLFLAYLGSRTILLIAFRGAKIIPIDTSPSLPVLGFAFLLSLITGIIFGAAPSWVSSHSDPAEALRGANRSTRDHSALPQKSLIVAQAAFSLLLLVMAGLVTQSLRNVEHLNFGFQPKGRLIVIINPLNAGYKPEQLPALYQQLRDRLHQLPGVLGVSYSLYSPQDGDSWSDAIYIRGRSLESTEGKDVAWLRVGPDYFKTIGTPLLRGRVIGEEDTPTSPQVAVVDETFARTFFPGEDPIGKHFGYPQLGHSGDIEIVGVVKDTQYRNPTSTEKQEPMFFRAFFQTTHFDEPTYQRSEVESEYIAPIELQVTGRAESLAPQVRQTLASIDPNLSIVEMRSLNEQVSRQFNEERLTARLTELFSLLALLLASIGLYGVTAYNIARRTGEIGIRMALGADRRDVLKMVLRGAVVQVGLGLLMGVPLALVAGRIFASKLFRVPAFNPGILTAAIFTLALCALIAGFLPAHRAASIHPAEALRME